MIRELAENTNTYTPLAPDEERIVDRRYVISLGAGSDPHFTVVQRLRLTFEEVDDAVDEIHALIAARGRTACTWEIGDSATPPDLVERLLARGCEPDREPLAIGMALTEPPYRALVRARWEDAVAHGTPVLVTHAGSMSRPILISLGFREVSRIDILLDRFGEG